MTVSWVDYDPPAHLPPAFVQATIRDAGQIVLRTPYTYGNGRMKYAGTPKRSIKDFYRKWATHTILSVGLYIQAATARG